MIISGFQIYESSLDCNRLAFRRVRGYNYGETGASSATNVSHIVEALSHSREAILSCRLVYGATNARCIYHLCINGSQHSEAAGCAAFMAGLLVAIPVHTLLALPAAL